MQLAMKAVPFYQHGSADVLKYEEEFPSPLPAKGQVIINVKYCGVNHLDIWTRMGIAGKKIKLPHVCGCDIVGTIKEDAAGFKAGERVVVYPGASCGICLYCKMGHENLCSQFAIIGGTSDYNGGYAQQVAVPATNVIPLKKMDSKIAATLSVSYLTAWNMLSSALLSSSSSISSAASAIIGTNSLNSRNKSGRTRSNSRDKKREPKKKSPVSSLLVYGAASGVGMATIQLARELGISTIITTGAGPEKVKFGKKLGADIVIDRNETKDIASEVVSKLGPVDMVVDHVGAATWQTSIAVLKPGGRMAVCGMTSGNNATVPVRMFYSKQITMAGALMGTKTQLVQLFDFVQRKKIMPVIDSVFSLRDAVQAQKRMEKGLHAGKILLQIS
jgi:NADPH:quinone reductase-like Zn-dependent oxidoreductase